MYLLIEVAGVIDAWPTIGLVMLTAIIGVALLKRQGLATLTRGMNRLNQGQIPAREMAEGLLLAVAGALLVTPGFITDGVGFLLLFPPTRMLIANEMLKRVQVQGATVSSSGFGPPPGPGAGPGSTSGPFTGGPSSASDGPVVIEGDYEKRN